MSFLRTAALLLVGAAAASASATTPTPFSQLRHDFPLIGTAIGNLPNSEINGTFNRLSAIYNRANVASATTYTSLPANYDRSMATTLEDLQADLASIGTLNDAQAAELFQVVSLYAYQRNFELYGAICQPTCVGHDGPGGGCTPTICVYPNSFYQTLNSIATSLQTTYTRLQAASSATGTPETLNGANFISAVHDVTHGIIGVESIDG